MTNHDVIGWVGGIEKAREIVEGVPRWCSHYRTDTKEVICCHNENHFYFQENVKRGVVFIRLDDLRIAIAECDSREFKENDQVVLINKPGSSNSIHRVLEVRHPTTIVVCPINQVSGNDLIVLAFMASPYYLRHVTGDEFNAGHRLDDTTDHVTDIRNHISPSTLVWDLAGGEDWSVEADL